MEIVIVDDDVLVAGALKTILEAGEDVKVTGTGRDGSEAMELYRRYPGQVTLMDFRVQMGGGHGGGE